jgi:hypothetical protein
VSSNTKFYLAFAGVFLAAVSSNAGPATPGAGITYDFNGDEKSDLLFEKIVAPNVGLMQIRLLDGVTVLSTTFPTTLSTGQEASGAGNFNGGSANAELLARKTTAPNLGILRMMNLNAGGTAVTSSAFPVTPGVEFLLVGVGDVDADGNDDLVYYKASGANTGLVRVIFMNANLTVKASTFPANFPADFVGAGVADVNGDGNADIIARKAGAPNQGLVRVFLMSANGLTVTSSTFPFTIPAGFDLRGIATLNDDDLADFAMEKTVAPSVGLIRLSMTAAGGVSIASSSFPLTLAAGTNVVALGNYDGVDHNDLAARKAAAPNAGLVRIILLNTAATAVASSGFPATVPLDFRTVTDSDPL